MLKLANFLFILVSSKQSARPKRNYPSVAFTKDQPSLSSKKSFQQLSALVMDSSLEQFRVMEAQCLSFRQIPFCFLSSPLLGCADRRHLDCKDAWTTAIWTATFGFNWDTVFSVTRRSRSDVGHSLSKSGDLSTDFTDVTLVSDDT